MMFKKKKPRAKRRSITPRPKEGVEMAKGARNPKATMATKPRQTMIEGTHDEPPADVREAADDYVTSKRNVAKCREKMNNSLADLISKMKAADVREMLIDNGEKKLILTEKDQIKIKARKEDKKADAA